MELRNSNPTIVKNNSQDLELQVLDWQCYDEYSEDFDEDEPVEGKYVMQIFGVDTLNQSVSIKVTDFKPRFYVNIPSNWPDFKIDAFIDTIKGKVKPQYKEAIQSHKIMRRKKFRGFTNNEKFKFIRFNFNSKKALYEYSKIFQKKITNPMLSKKPKKYEVYESNIDAFLRFCHIKDLKTSGWITLPKKKYQLETTKKTYCQNEFSIKWNNVKPSEKSHIAPLLTLSFDIECDSSHGDFPLAKKNYKKLAAELLDNINYRFKKVLDDKLKTKELQEDGLLQTQILIDLIKLSFRDKPNDQEISFCYSLDNIKPKSKHIEQCAKKIKDILFIRLLREENYKELREAVDKTKKQWANQSIEMLKEIICPTDKDGKNSMWDNTDKKEGISGEYNIHPNKILNRILTRDILVEKTTDILDSYFPELEGDKVIQIGSTINRYGEDNCCLKHIVTLNTCNPIEGAIVVPCETEQQVLIEWSKFVRELDPDLVTGYNIFGFDFKFIYDRAFELDIIDDMGTLGRMRNKELILEEKNLSSSALGDNILTYLSMEGRVQMDLLKVIQKDHKLASYKLDNVAETFISGGIKRIVGNRLEIGSIGDLNLHNYISIYCKNDKYQEGKKFKIINITPDYIELDEPIEESIIGKKPSWRLAKDDIGPKDIFRLQKQDAEGRKIVAQYCIQDCALCNKLVNKLSIISNNIGMANVCSVPLTYIFLRGQGIKILSLVSKECRDFDFLLPVLKKPKTDEQKEEEQKRKKKYPRYYDDDSSDEEDTGGYEGAIVLEPNPGIYLETPITVLDYSSLYPSSMISENLSHDTYVLDDKYDNLPGVEYKDITYDVYEWIDPKIKSKGKKKVGQKTCRFVQFPDGDKGVIPKILMKLLSARKTTRKKILYRTVTDNHDHSFSGLVDKETDDQITIKTVEGESETFEKKNVVSINDTYNEFEKEVLDGLQLAYKVTANSLYGQIGAQTSAIYLKDIAASTTATGRNLLYLAREKTEEKFEGAKIVYGDTDSIFINFNPKDEEGNLLKHKEALQKSIELGVEAEKYIQQFLSKPHKLEYEKTFWPFILFTKKRYIGDKYEFDLDKYKQTSMGIVTKRRDNADIVKHIYGGIMNIIMKEKDINKSIDFLQEELKKLILGEFPLDMLTITKSLKSYYKNPESIGHKVLADRIGEREPGNKPMSNDRVPYIYVQVEEKKGQKLLQGDKIESPSFIIEKKLKPDYLFYITNQILKPVSQIYALIVNQLPGYTYDEDYLNRIYLSYLDKHGDKKAHEKITNKRNEIAAYIIFEDIIREANNKRKNINSIDTWCKVTNLETIKKKTTTNTPKVKKDAIDHRKVRKELEKQGVMKPLTNWFTKVE